MATTTARPRLSDEFVQKRKADRIAAATARLLSEERYDDVKISTIVKQAGVARKTLYDNFEGKEAVARGIVERVDADIAARFAGAALEDSTLAVIVVELAARIHVGGSTAMLDDLERLLTGLAAFDPADVQIVAADAPELATLPPGRHGLPRRFVNENQRQRLLSGFAAAVCASGYRCLTVESVARTAAVSRRTFYEQFSDGLRGVTVGFLDFAGISVYVPDSPLLGLGTEIVAAGIHEGQEKMTERLDEAVHIYAELAAARKRD